MRKNLFIHLVFVLPLFFVINCKQDIDNVEKEHTFSEWKVESEPTCTSIGLKKRKCTGCGFEETEIIPAKGHNWNQGVITAKATCTSAGVKTYTCSRCKEEKTEVIPANGHKWDSGIVTKQPTCTENGIRTYTCSVCNEIKMESVKARGHSFDGIECKNCHEYSVTLKEIGKTYTDADGLNVTLNSFTYTNTDGYNNYSINYTLKNNIPSSEKGPGIFKIIYKTSSDTLESSYQTGFFNNLYYGNTLTRSYNWKLTADKTFVCLEYIADSQMSSYIFSATPSDELLNWIDGEVSYDDIDNIPPAPVTNLQAKYDKNSKQIIVTWKNPKDEDFDCVNLSYTKGGLAVVSNEKIAKETYSISNVEIDGDDYLFTLVAVDWMGNISTSSTINITPSEIPAVQSIELSRYHLAYDDPDQTIKAVARISNAELLDDDTVVKIQVKDSDGNVTNTIASVDRIEGRATATIKVPSKSSNSNPNGNNFTVLCKINDESADSIHTARFNVSSGAVLNIVEQCFDNYFTSDKIHIALNNVNSNSKEIIRIGGHNLDLSTINIQLFDSTGEAYYTVPIVVDTTSLSWTSESGENYQIIDSTIPIPTTDDLYTVKVIIDGDIQSVYLRSLQVFDVPKFTSYYIPRVNVTKAGNAVTALIVGKNFDTPNIDLSNFSAICSSNPVIVSTSGFIKESDSILYATFTIPDTVGEYEITVKYDSNSIKGILKVQDFSNYSVGDVLLDDGTIIPYDSDNLSFSDEEKAKAIGIMYGFTDYGVPAGWLGLYNSADGTNSGKYKWALSGTTGYDKSFSDIICTPNDSSYGIAYAYTATFSGDIDGSDNWEYICSIDPDGTANATTNYPAFNYVNNYVASFGLKGVGALGWYMPSLAELCYIYRNKDVLDTILDTLEAVQLLDNFYWSSSWCADCYGAAWGILLPYNQISCYNMDNDFYVCCVRAFE